MRPKNFPERKNQRRKRALENLKAYAKKNDSSNLKKAIKNTEAKITENVISVRTKKMRTKVGK